MAAFSAAVSLRAPFSQVLHDWGAALSPEYLNICEFAAKELKSFQDFVERLDRRSRKRLSASLERVTGEINKFGDELDGYEFDQFVEKMHLLVGMMKKMEEEYNEYSLLDEDEEEVTSSSSSSSSRMVGIRDERSDLKEALVDSSLSQSVFLLHGMAGIGKTTLARDVYNDLDISEWFECRAWVEVDLCPYPADMERFLLLQLNPDAYKVLNRGDSCGIGDRLSETLMCKRYLIVVDGVWDTRQFENYWYGSAGGIREDNQHRSRFVVTSRMSHLDYCTITWAWYVLEKRLLSKEESWELLCEKAFVGGLCPSQLEEAGKKIADKCEGLPLSIITVADLLSKAEESIWIDVAVQKRHHLFVDVYDRISKVLYPSYDHLIDELKLCFLYMGVFPLKCEISRRKLINLWIVEDIFDPAGFYNDLESLNTLHFRSFLMVYQRNGTYFNSHKLIRGIRTCGLHSSWWHFCQREARKSKFFHVIDCPEDSSEEGLINQSRLSIQNNVLFARKNVYDSVEKHCASNAQSLLCVGQYHQYQVPMCFGLKLLQRLDALNIRFYDFPLEVLGLIKLRYLALTCNGELPTSISKLGRLQYLIVHPHLSIKSRGAPSYMPKEIWDLEELKHLQVMGSDLPASGDKSLLKLSTLSGVSTRSCSILSRVPFLKKLKIRIELAPDATDPFCFSAHISNLIKLESLKCIVVNPECKLQVVPSVASFPVLPSQLTKLSLSGLGYPWEDMRRINSFSSLHQLKLQCNAFQGQNWVVEEWEFPILHSLILEDIDLVKLEGAPGSFKTLFHLSIKDCYKLEEVQLPDFYSVSEIEIVDSNPLVEKSIKTGLIKGSHPSGTDISVHYSWKSARAASIRRNAAPKWG